MVTLLVATQEGADNVIMIYPRQKRVDPMVVDRQKVRGFIEGVSLAIFAERIPGL
jgi:hypothetical protein